MAYLVEMVAMDRKEMLESKGSSRNRGPRRGSQVSWGPLVLLGNKEQVESQERWERPDLRGPPERTEWTMVR